MELILQTGLEHQQKPVDAISDVLNSVHINLPTNYFENPLIDLTDVKIMSNIKDIQIAHQVHRTIQNRTTPEKVLNLDIKMETGTGKTYVYTHAIYELHKRYGINKFVLAVPSLPIKAGAQSFIADPYVQRHFKNTCSYSSTIDLCVLKAMTIKKGKRFFPSVVRTFVEGSCQNTNKIYVLLVNMALLTNGNLLTRNDYDNVVQGFNRPLDAIRATKPFVIIDEPHRFARDQKAYNVIVNELQPQCIIRFGATFPTLTIGRGKNKAEKKDYENLLYNLDACCSFNQNLIKGVAKEHFQSEISKNEKVKITSIESKEIVTFNHRTSVANHSYTLRTGDSLGVISNDLSGLVVSGIGKGYIELSNGQIKNVNEEFEVSIYSSSYQEQMLRLAIQRHFETERINFNRAIKIKTLALFFIDNIESFRGDKDGNGAWLREMFDRLLLEQIERELTKQNTGLYKAYLEASKANIAACRAGYFAQDNSDSDDAIAKEIDDILHNKKELLAFTKADGTFNTRRFLFSKWTLKEGWDNPNVFTITKLRSSGSENSKLQEVGRGLRLPVDEFGNRISNEEFMLNYIVDFTEADFASKLVEQINSDVPTESLNAISREDLLRVAELRGKNEMDLMMELYSKQYITDSDRSLNSDKLCEFYEEYPEFNKSGVSKSKVIDRNKHTTNTIRVRKVQFEELRSLWTEINKKYILFFYEEVNGLIEKELISILNDGVFAPQTVKSERAVLDTSEGVAEILTNVGVEYVIPGRKIPYREFLIRANRATSIPIISIHKAICQYAKANDFADYYINESSLTRFIQCFNDWKCINLQEKFDYKKTNYSSMSSALTNADGSLKSEIVQGAVGIHLERGNVSDKYLYDTIAYDSPLERSNIVTEIEEVVVYAKIPRRSISIPTIADSSYSPDFMYVVKKKNGKKELNIIIETKDVENKIALRKNEIAKISCAKKFFEQLNIDGYTVYFREQINNESVAAIISELIAS